MTAEEFKELVRLGYEAPGLEFKPPALIGDARVFSEVVRAALAFSNRRGGGRIVVGVAEDRVAKELIPVGLTATQSATWNRDDFSSKLASYAAPMIDFDQTILDSEGKLFLIITVEEFRHSPVICTRTRQVDGDTVLRDGALYVRGRRKPESVEVSSYEEMRELIDLAVEKGIQRFGSQVRQAGLLPQSPPAPTPKQVYDEELGRLL